MLGDIRTIKLTHKGGIFPLQPIELLNEECCAVLRVPEGVVAKGDDVTVEYAILLSGPFRFPEKSRRVSVVLYLHCSNSSLLCKPITVKLRHWAVFSEGTVTRMSFAKASHILPPNENEFVFTQVRGNQFDSEAGILHLKDHFCLCGICEMIETGVCNKVDVRCYGMLIQAPFLGGKQRFFLCAMYAVPSWITVSKYI